MNKQGHSGGKVDANQVEENLLGVATRRGQDRPDECGKTDGQDVKQGVAHNTPILTSAGFDSPPVTVKFNQRRKKMKDEVKFRAKSALERAGFVCGEGGFTYLKTIGGFSFEEHGLKCSEKDFCVIVSELLNFWMEMQEKGVDDWQLFTGLSIIHPHYKTYKGMAHDRAIVRAFNEMRERIRDQVSDTIKITADGKTIEISRKSWEAIKQAGE